MVEGEGQAPEPQGRQATSLAQADGVKRGRREKEQKPRGPSSWDLMGGNTLLSGDGFSVAFPELGS